jgi:hypothetical protein
MWEGRDPRTRLPVILGHEGAGEIAEMKGEKRDVYGIPLKAGDKVTINLPMIIRHVIANEKVQDDRGKAAIECGPIVYCLEGIDNDSLEHFTLPDSDELYIEKRNNFLNGVNGIVAVDQECIACRTGCGRRKHKPNPE